MKALLTGATGFVGAAVLRRLLAEGIDVRILVRKGMVAPIRKGLPIEFMAGELLDPVDMKQAVSGCSALFHVAADYRLWVPDPQTMYAINVKGTLTLMQAALDAGLERIVYTSSVAVLGLRPDGQAADEETPSMLEDMVGHYKRSKFMAEEEVHRLCREAGLPAIIVNPSTPIGPGDSKPTPTGRMVRDAIAGKIPAYVDTGLNIVHVDDVAQGHWLAFKHGKIGERYILGGQNLSLKFILTRLAQIAGRSPPMLRLPRFVLYPLAAGAQAWIHLRGRGVPRVTLDELRMTAKKMYFSSAKAERELGYNHRPAEHAFVDAVQWFQENPCQRGVTGK